MPDTVHKIELRPDINYYLLPFGAELLHADIQHGVPCLWFRRSLLASTMEERIILLTGTGHHFDDPPTGKTWKFISTMLTQDQNFVFHVFELVNEDA